jgi:hypothetical protein
MTQGEAQTKFFDDNYIEQAFQQWYALNQPSNMELQQEALPETPEGRKPGNALLRQYRDTYGWRERADGLNALAIQKADVAAVDNKARLIERQAMQTREIVDRAREKILEEGFDTTASAVKAYFTGIEQERLLVGISNMMVQVSKMTPEKLEARALELLRRRNEAIEGEVEDVNADLGEETTE